MSLSTRVLAGLGLGLAAGIVAHTSHVPALLRLAADVEPVGQLWVNAILMTVVPLVVSSLIVGVAATGDPRRVGRLGRRAVGLFVLLVAGAAALTALVAPLLLAGLPVTAATRATLPTGLPAASPPVAVPTVGAWLVALVPSNPIRAAADGALLPLVVFTLAFALALTRVEPTRRAALVHVFEAVAAATRVLVGWVLTLAPLGVFALVVPLAARLGVAAAGALAYYVAVVAALCLVLLLTLYPIAVIGGRVPLRDFARAAAPAQAVAFGSRSSLAALPALIDGAEQRLGLSSSITGFTLPFAVTTFKCCAPTTMVVGALFLSQLYAVPLDAFRVAQTAAVSVLLSFAVPGVPGGGLLVAAPIFAALGLPPAGIALLLAVDTVPDMFRTLANVTADLAVAAILGRTASRPGVVESTALPVPRGAR